MAPDDTKEGKATARRPSRPRRACPVCGKPADPGFRPFCSARCRQVDLGRWLAGDYAIPGAPEDGPAEDEPSR